MLHYDEHKNNQLLVPEFHSYSYLESFFFITKIKYIQVVILLKDMVEHVLNMHIEGREDNFVDVDD